MALDKLRELIELELNSEHTVKKKGILALELNSELLSILGLNSPSVKRGN